MTVKTLPFSKMFNYQTGRTVSVTGSESIRSCLAMLLSTCKGELIGDPNFGCNVKKLLMNYKGSVLYAMLKSDIAEAIKRYEKRVTVNENDVTLYTSKSNPNLIYVNICYYNKLNGSTETLALTLNEEEISK